MSSSFSAPEIFRYARPLMCAAGLSLGLTACDQQTSSVSVASEQEVDQPIAEASIDNAALEAELGSMVNELAAGIEVMVENSGASDAEEALSEAGGDVAQADVSNSEAAASDPEPGRYAPAVDPEIRVADPLEEVDALRLKTIAAFNEEHAYLEINVLEQYVDMKTVVNGRDLDFLELLVCYGSAKAHESLLSTEAKPSDIHLALLLMGLAEGTPMSWERDDEAPNGFRAIAATGPLVHVLVAQDVGNGQIRETPLTRWLKDHRTERRMRDALFRFTGSRMVEYNDGSTGYMADEDGLVLSLAHFGHDLLVLDQGTAADGLNPEDGIAAWSCRPEVIPRRGFEVTLRLRPAEVVEPEQESDAD